jgi:hypothetical protein
MLLGVPKAALLKEDAKWKKSQAKKRAKAKAKKPA